MALELNLAKIGSIVFGLCGLLDNVLLSPVYVGSPNDQQNETETQQACITVIKTSEQSNCSLCYNPACPILYDDMIESFGHELATQQNRTQRAESNPSHCPFVKLPESEAEYGCLYVPKVGIDGCVTCYSYTCLHCNYTESREFNITVKVQLPNQDAEPYPIMINSKLRFTTPEHCPPVAPHSNELSAESQDCVYVPQRGADGCIESYTLVCPQKPGSRPADHPVVANNAVKPSCPVVKPPANKTMAGCVFTEHYDSNGCVVAYDMICSKAPVEDPRPPSKPASNPASPQTSRNQSPSASPSFDWRRMLGDAYRGAALTDPKRFRPRASIAVPSSGHFVACKRQSDCFYYREPKEWCVAANANSTLYAWTDKSCYCATDTEKRTCLVERVNMRTKLVEWTFCVPKKDYVCSL